jgi:hypothetical protein
MMYLQLSQYFRDILSVIIWVALFVLDKIAMVKRYETTHSSDDLYVRLAFAKEIVRLAGWCSRPGGIREGSADYGWS